MRRALFSPTSGVCLRFFSFFSAALTAALSTYEFEKFILLAIFLIYFLDYLVDEMFLDFH